MTRWLAAILVAIIGPGATAQASPLPTDELRLPNGAHVVLAPDDTVATVVVHVRVEGTGGDAGELVEQALDHFHDIDGKLDAVGGWTSSLATRDHASYALEVPAEALELALFRDAERFVHVDAAAAEAQRADVDHDRRGLAGTRAAIVATALGTERFSPVGAARGDIEAVLRRMYAPANLTIVLAGRFDPARARGMVSRYFGALRGPTAAARARSQPETPPPAQPGTLHDARADRVTVAFAVPEPLTSASLDLELAARVLAARLAKRDVRVDPPFVIEGAGGGAREAILDALAGLRDTPVSRDELARAVAMLDTEKVIAFENLAYRAQAIAEARAYAETPRYLEAWRDRLHAVTARSVQTTATVWLAEAKAIVVGDAP